MSMPGKPPKWAEGIPELEELRERKNPNLDYLFERPATACLGTDVITTLSYLYDERQNQWYWSPYSIGAMSVEQWIPVEEHRVPAGYGQFARQKPAPCNLKIIKYLEANNPDPTGGKKGSKSKTKVEDEKHLSVKRTIEITPEGKKIIEEVTKPDGTKTVTETLERAQ